MFFNSIDFAFFLPIVFVLYWYVFNKSVKTQNILVVFVSYVFYGWWDWRFLSLILFSTVIDFTIGLRLSAAESPRRRKALLWVSILANLGFLGFFKYYDFFLDNFVSSFSFLGLELNVKPLEIILPVGISFYTFQTLSYTIDVYKKKLTPTDDLIAFSAFVCFFPQLVAGPIERATHLIPQFYVERKFNYAKAVDGTRQILWGLFKKVIIADNCAEYANEIFNNSGEYSGLTLVFGAVFFSFQIYGDFSGYSDIAIGSSRLFGFDLKRNFAFPYFSRDIAEFWRRWHISLSTWFRDYLYIPLGGSRGRLYVKLRNTFVIFLVSGFWHGANWTFIVWGALNALYFLPLLLTNNNRNNLEIVAKERKLPSLKDLGLMILTFSLSAFAWIFFRAENVNHGFEYINDIFSDPLSFIRLDIYLQYKFIILLLIVFICTEWVGRREEYAFEKIGSNWVKPLRYGLYYVLMFGILWYCGKEQQFIYFQF